MALEFSTIGFKLKWCAESTAGTRPTSGYVEITDIVDLPAINAAPEGIDVTNLVDTWRRRIAGLRDAGESLAIRSNGTTAFNTSWGAAVTAYATAKAAGKDMWFEIVFPADSGYTQSFFFSGEPMDPGFYGASVGNAYQGDNYIIPRIVEGLATAST